MQPERIEKLAGTVDKLREFFNSCGAFPLAADMRDVYMLLLNKRDEMNAKVAK